MMMRMVLGGEHRASAYLYGIDAVKPPQKHAAIADGRCQNADVNPPFNLQSAINNLQFQYL